MRWSSVLVLVLMAGCSGGGDPVVHDEPIHDRWELHHFGPGAEDPDAYVAVVDCYAPDQLKAYTVDVAAAMMPGADQIELYTTHDWARPAASDIQRFIIVAFVPEGAALVPSLAIGGNHGLDTAGYTRASTGSLAQGMPDRFSVPVGADGLARFVLGCDGPGTFNYVIANEEVNDRNPPSRPHYMPSVDGQGYAAFLGHATDQTIASIPPIPTGMPQTVVYEVGPVRVAVQHDDVPGALRGTTTTEWTAGPGWTHVHCGHQGNIQHATWNYDADLHGEPREAAGVVASNPGTSSAPGGLSAASVFHLGGGDAPATLRFEVQHELSLALFWNTGCDGFHLATTLDALFGMPAGTHWAPSNDAT